MSNKYLVFIFLLGFPTFILAQISAPGIQLFGGGSAGFGDTKPYWNVSNQHGLYALNPFNGMAGLSLESIDSSDTFININYGVEFHGSLEQKDRFMLQRGYVELKSPFLSFWAGRKYEILGNQDSLLSIGSTVWSRNARPMPKLVLATPGYISVPFTKGYVEVNGSLAHGWFEKDRYVQNVYMHQKFLHFRVGGDLPINLSAGLIHFAQWGGSSPNPRFGKLPSDFGAYKRVFLAQNGDSATVDPAESINKLGNHLGSRTYRIDYKGTKVNTSIYYQTLFEDGSGLAREFYIDGLTGFIFKSKNRERIVNHIIIEYLHTTWQSGPTHNLNDSVKLIGNDNYFNNYIYRSGWTYKGMTIGTPLITSPVYNENNEVGILNNRVLGFHLGLGGKIKGLDYKSFFTYSINKGTYARPFESDKNQFSWYIETTVPDLFWDVDMTIMLAADIGEMYGNNLGVNLIFRKSFDIFGK